MMGLEASNLEGSCALLLILGEFEEEKREETN